MPASQHALSLTLAASPAVDPEWHEAYLRVTGYLRALHLQDEIQIKRLATSIIAEATGLRKPAEPAARAMRVVQERIEAWLARAGKGNDWAKEMDPVHGRLALVIANLPGRWADSFLSADAIPPGLSSALTGWHFHPGPELDLTVMPPAPLEFGFDESTTLPDGRVAVWPLVRLAACWLLIIGLISAAWLASH